MLKYFLNVVALLSLSLAAFAHGAKEEHVMGVVVSVSPQKLVVKSEGHNVEIMLMPTTVFERSHRKATVKDLKSGDKVVVDITEAGEMLHANKVVFGKQ